MKTINSEAFYNLMQAYSLASIAGNQDSVDYAYGDIIDYLDNQIEKEVCNAVCKFNNKLQEAFASNKAEVTKERYFVNSDGFRCNTQCLIVEPNGVVLGLMMNGDTVKREHYSLKDCEAYVEEGLWIEFTPRGE